MILIFDYFETIVHNKSTDFNRGLKVMWEKYYKDKCSFEEIKAYGEELFHHMVSIHETGKEFAFVKEELPLYAGKYGGEVIQMSAEEEADFLMLCNEMENMPGIPEALQQFENQGIPMYVLSNSGFTAKALSVSLEKFGIRKYFKRVWSSADFGEIKPSRNFFEMAIENVLYDNPGEKREDIVFIGDTYTTDVIGANRAGLKVIWLNHKKEKNADKLPVSCIFETRELTNEVKNIKEEKTMGIHSIDAEDDQFAYRYDTQLLIDRRDKDLDEDAISDYILEHFEGNSLIAAGDEDLIKIHFHTNEPWKILEYCNSIGEIYDIVVEDMIRQANGMQG